jgi:hypothetical protein
VRNVSRVKLPNRFNVALALIKVLIERRVVDGVSVWVCGEGEDEGFGNGSCKGGSEDG